MLQEELKGSKRVCTAGSTKKSEKEGKEIMFLPSRELQPESISHRQRHGVLLRTLHRCSSTRHLFPPPPGEGGTQQLCDCNSALAPGTSTSSWHPAQRGYCSITLTCTAQP